MENELIRVTVNEEGIQCVSARELHEFLEIGTRFDIWFGRMVDYGFQEGMDYEKIVSEVHVQKRTRTYEQVDYAITLDMAKELSMIQRTEKGKQARQYFIQCEKKLKEVTSQQPQLALEEQLALQVFKGGITAMEATRQLIDLEKKPLLDTIETQKPKVQYTEQVLASNLLITVSSIAKDFGLTARKLNLILKEQHVQFKQGKQWLLYSEYQDKGYVQSYTDKDGHVNTKWTQKGKEFIVKLLKDLGYKLQILK